MPGLNLDNYADFDRQLDDLALHQSYAMNFDKPKVAICGAGLVGALNACFFAKRGWNVDVYEYREDLRKVAWNKFSGRSISLSMSHRARSALRHVGLEEMVLSHCTFQYGRYVHMADGKDNFYTAYSRNGEFIASMNRRLLNELLLTAAEKYPNVRIHFEHKLQNYDIESKQLIFESKLKTRLVVTGDLIVACDGAYSCARRSLIKTAGFNFSQEYIDHGYIELIIPPTLENDFAMDPNKFHLWPRGECCLIALANTDKTYNATFFAPFELFEQLADRNYLKTFFQSNFSDAANLMGWESILEAFDHSTPNKLVSIKCSPHHKGDNFILMGDSAHAMVPFYAQGMNCGFEDCLVLSELLDKHKENIGEAISAYSQQRVQDAEAICNLAMYNYKELRYLVPKRGFQFRRRLDNCLNRILSDKWIPLYSMVTFSRKRYHEVLEHKRWQDKTLENTKMSLAAVFGFCFLTTLFNLFSTYFRFE